MASPGQTSMARYYLSAQQILYLTLGLLLESEL
jgi:hypothetical protein